MTMATRVLNACAFIVLVVTTSACSRSGEVAGDIFLTTMSGDVKRGAGLEVLLIARSKDFDRDWQTLRAEHRKAVDQRAAELERAQRARTDRVTPFRAWVETNMQYMSKAVGVLKKYSTKSTRSDVNGHFLFSDVRHGRYLLFGAFQIGRDTVTWLAPLNVESSTTRVDLSDANAEHKGEWPFTAETERAVQAGSKWDP